MLYYNTNSDVLQSSFFQMQFTIFAAVAIFAACFVNAVPIQKRSPNGRLTAEFEMSKARVAAPDQLLEEISRRSKRSAECPEHVLEGSEYPVEMRSTCPWHYVVDHKADRFPATILVANSTCNFCIGSNGLMCEAIKRSVTVFEQKFVNGAVSFEGHEIEINVGYTCAGARTVSNGTPAPPSQPPADGDYPDYA